MQPIESIGAGSRNRTRDPLITNQVLYQLSYAGASRILAECGVKLLRRHHLQPRYEPLP
jgi:hypothetical protein